MIPINDMTTLVTVMARLITKWQYEIDNISVYILRLFSLFVVVFVCNCGKHM